LEIIDVDRKCKKLLLFFSREYDLQLNQRWTRISDDELIQKIIKLRGGNRRGGWRMLSGALKAHGIYVPYRRLRLALYVSDPGGAVLRRVANNLHRRRKYSVPGPNSLWHMDGYHKLIRWNIVNQFQNLSIVSNEKK